MKTYMNMQTGKKITNENFLLSDEEAVDNGS
jgi:hypothetical protein